MKKIYRDGFTIVELVIVIAIIGVLAGILIPTFTILLQNAENNELQLDLELAYTEYSTDAQDGYIGNISTGIPTVLIPKEDTVISRDSIYYMLGNDGITWVETERGALEEYYVYNGCLVGLLSTLEAATLNSILLETAYGCVRTDTLDDAKFGSWGYSTTALGIDEYYDHYAKYQMIFVYKGTEYASRFYNSVTVPRDILFYPESDSENEHPYHRGRYIGEYDNIYVYENANVQVEWSKYVFNADIGRQTEANLKSFYDEMDLIYDQYVIAYGDNAKDSQDVTINYPEGGGDYYIQSDLGDWYLFNVPNDGVSKGVFDNAAVYEIDRKETSTNEVINDFENVYNSFFEDTKDGYVGLPILDPSNFYNKIKTTYNKSDIIIKFNDAYNKSQTITYDYEKQKWQFMPISAIERIGQYQGFDVYYRLNSVYRDKLSTIADRVYEEYVLTTTNPLSRETTGITMNYSRSGGIIDWFVDQGDGYWNYCPSGLVRSRQKTIYLYVKNSHGSSIRVTTNVYTRYAYVELVDR